MIAAASSSSTSMTTPQHKQSILNDFHQKIGTYGPGTTQNFPFSASNQDMRHLTLPFKTVNNCFQQALDGPFRLAEASMAKLIKRYGRDILVVVTGGTSYHEAVQGEVKRLCTKHGIQRGPVFADDELEIKYG